MVEHELGQQRFLVAQVEPLYVDGVRTMAVGTGLWVVALVAMLPFVGTLRANGQLPWLWVCLAGVGLGLIGLEYCRRRRAGVRRTAGRRRIDAG